MSKKPTYEHIRNEIEKEGYTLLSKSYKNSREKLDVRCPEGHVYRVNWNNFKTGKRCPKCANKKKGQYHKLKIENINNELNKLDHLLLSEEYKDSNTKLKIKCPNGHVFEMSYSNFKTGCRCPECYNENRQIKKEEIIKKLSFVDDIKEINNEIYVACKYCGKYHKPKRKRLLSRIRFINGQEEWEYNFYCSNKCKKECPIYNQREFPKGFKPATSREVQPELRQLVFKRDEYTCQKCHKHKDDLDSGLHCHHIDPVINNPVESADIDNCITLCKECHRKTHKISGCNYSELRCETHERIKE